MLVSCRLPKGLRAQRVIARVRQEPLIVGWLVEWIVGRGDELRGSRKPLQQEALKAGPEGVEGIAERLRRPFVTRPLAETTAPV